MADESAPPGASTRLPVDAGEDGQDGEHRRPEPAARQGRVTLREVARAAGVAPSTVSRVLGGVTTSIAVTDATRELVLQRARELGYRPDPLARGLRGSSTGLIGLIVRDLAYPLHGPLIEATVDAIRAHDHHVVIGSSHELSSESYQLEHIIQTRMCDGIIMIGGLDDDAAVLDDLQVARVPTVGIGLAITNGRIPVVRGDGAAGGRLVFDHLAALGHRHVGIVQTGDHTEFRERTDAFAAAAAEAGWPTDAISLVICENESADVAAAFQTLMKDDRPTAVFVTTDYGALVVLAEAARAGVDVPHELSVVGYDDLAMSRTVYPPLTTVRQDLGRLAARAVDSVFALIRTGAVPEETGQRVAIELVVRGTSGPGGGRT